MREVLRKKLINKQVVLCVSKWKLLFSDYTHCLFKLNYSINTYSLLSDVWGRKGISMASGGRRTWVLRCVSCTESPVLIPSIGEILGKSLSCPSPDFLRWTMDRAEST